MGYIINIINKALETPCNNSQNQTQFSPTKSDWQVDPLDLDEKVWELNNQ
jgi:hypothetical protein